LIAYGDFFNRNHPLVPPGYCQEFWILELEKAALEKFPKLQENPEKNNEKNLTYREYLNIDIEKLSQHVRIPADKLDILFRRPTRTKISAQAAIELSKKLNIPLHPQYTYFWKSITLYELKNFVTWLSHANIAHYEERPERHISLIC
jgi:DNA polymerase II large subunit